MQILQSEGCHYDYLCLLTYRRAWNSAKIMTPDLYSVSTKATPTAEGVPLGKSAIKLIINLSYNTCHSVQFHITA